MFKINSTKIKDETITSNVTFTLADQTELTIDVSVFQPLTKEEVLQGIANREISEQHKYDSTLLIETIKSELDTELGNKISLVEGQLSIEKVNIIK